MRLTTIFLCLAITGCSSQQVVLQPQVTATTRFPDAHGQLITLAVRDERPTEAIGMRGTNSRLGDITPAGDVTTALSRQIAAALETSGFRVESAPAVTATMVVDLRDLTFAEHAGAFSGKRQTTAALNARVMRDSRITFEKLYRGASANNGMFVGSSRGNAALVNSALDVALKHLASDGELMAALASSPK